MEAGAKKKSWGESCVVRNDLSKPDRREKPGIERVQERSRKKGQRRSVFWGEKRHGQSGAGGLELGTVGRWVRESQGGGRCGGGGKRATQRSIVSVLNRRRMG